MSNITVEKANEVAGIIVDHIVSDLTDRKGLRHEWSMINSDVKSDILNQWQDIIVSEIRKHLHE